MDKDWTKLVQDLFPFKINRFSFINSEVWFGDVTTQPKVDVFITNMFLVGTNFTTAARFPPTCPPDFLCKGAVLEMAR